MNAQPGRPRCCASAAGAQNRSARIVRMIGFVFIVILRIWGFVAQRYIS